MILGLMIEGQKHVLQSILNLVTELHTIELYHVFQKDDKKGTTCAQEKVQETDSCMVYKSVVGQH